MENLNKSVDSADTERISYGDQIVVATNCLYRNYSPSKERVEGDTDGIRGDLTLATIGIAINSGIQVIAADGGSSPDFLSVLEQFQNRGLTLLKSTIPGRAPQRRKAFEAATILPNSKVIV